MAIYDSNRYVNIFQGLTDLYSNLIEKGLCTEEDLNSDFFDYQQCHFSIYDEELGEYTLISFIWDRVDESFFVNVVKQPDRNSTGAFDEKNLYDQKTHRVYPKFISGIPTVAGCREQEVMSYTPTRIEVENSIASAEFTSRTGIVANFAELIIGPSINYSTVALYGATSGEVFTATDISYNDKKIRTINITLSGSVSYSTEYTLLCKNVMSINKQIANYSINLTSSSSPIPCGPITDILIEAYDYGVQTLTPLTSASYSATHSNNQFIYYETPLSWEAFNDLQENIFYPIVVPDEVTHPTSIIAYYKEGAYLLPDAAWIVGLIGTNQYESEFGLFTLDEISGYKQLTPLGSTTDSCGTDNWGGNWGDSLIQFAINRDES